MYKHMIISPITKEELKMNVTTISARNLRQIQSSSKNKVQRSEEIKQMVRRTLVDVTSVPIILTFPFTAAIPAEYSDFKCNVLKKNGEEFETDVNTICEFQGIIEVESNSFVKCNCTNVGYGVWYTNTYSYIDPRSLLLLGMPKSVA